MSDLRAGVLRFMTVFIWMRASTDATPMNATALHTHEEEEGGGLAFPLHHKMLIISKHAVQLTSHAQHLPATLGTPCRPAGEEGVNLRPRSHFLAPLNQPHRLPSCWFSVPVCSSLFYGSSACGLRADCRWRRTWPGGEVGGRASASRKGKDWGSKGQLNDL